MVDCLWKIDDMSVVREAKAALGGEALLEFVSPEYAAHCEAVYSSIGSPVLTGLTIWAIFEQMIPVMLSQ